MATLFQKLRQKYSLTIPFILISFTVSACGGGGGSGVVDTGINYSGNLSLATLTDANAGELASSALSNAGSGVSLVLSATGNNTSSGPTSSHALTIAKTLKSLVTHIETNPETISTSNALAANAYSDTMDGDCGGQATITFSGDDTGSFSGTMNFNNYCEGNETINGAITISGKADAAGEIVSLTMTFVRLTFTSGNESATATGTVSMDATNNTVTVEMVMQDHVTNKTCWVNDYTITTKDFVTYEEVTISSGRFYDSEHGYVEVATTSPLLINYVDNYPHAGSIKITAANDASAILTAQLTTYTITIDKDGNGDYETTLARPWTGPVQ